jgi:phosphatidylglycerol:prolipoprotein diacylglycerol transferase
MFPIHLNFFGNLNTFYEGLYFALGVAFAFAVTFRMAGKYGVDKDTLSVTLVVALVSGIVGASLFQQLFYKEVSSFSEVFTTWSKGLSITGAVIIGPLLTYLYCRYKKLPYWRLFAIVVPGIILAQGVGRLGCFMNGDAHGTASELPWAMSFPRYGHTVPGFERLEGARYDSDAWEYSVENGLVSATDMRSARVHPSQLYEFLADVMLFFLLLWLLQRVVLKSWNEKIVPFAYIGGYALIRFLIEFTRADRELSAGATLSQMQWILLVVFAACLILISRQVRQNSQTSF